MKKNGMRVLSFLLMLCMVVTLLPTEVFAAVSRTKQNSAVQNAALLQQLKGMYGTDAEGYLQSLEENGLVDENGQIITDAKINVDGKDMTLDEVEALLSAPDVDLAKVVYVDGTPLTLENLKTMLEIERELARLQATYFSPQHWTEEQLTSLDSLAQAAERGELQMLGSEKPQGSVNHDLKIQISLPITNGSEDKEDIEGFDGSFTVSLVGAPAPGQKVTFHYDVTEGSARKLQNYGRTGNNYGEEYGDVTLTAEQPSVSIGIPIRRARQDADYWTKDHTYFAHVSNVKGALFANGTDSDTKTMYIRGSNPYPGGGEFNGLPHSFMHSDVGNRATGQAYLNRYTAPTVGGPVLLHENAQWYVNEVFQGVNWYDWFVNNATTATIDWNSALENPAQQRVMDIGFAEGILTHLRDFFSVRTYADKEGVWDSVRILGGKPGDDQQPVQGGIQRNYYWKTSTDLTSSYRLSDPKGMAMPQENGGIDRPGISFSRFFSGYTKGYHFWSGGIQPYDGTAPYAVGLSVPKLNEERKYAPGQSIPIAVDFNEPVWADKPTTRLVVNGKSLAPAERHGTLSKRLTFLYPVTAGSPANLSVTRIDGLIDVVGYHTNGITYSGTENAANGYFPGMIDWVKPQYAIGSLTADCTSDAENPATSTLQINVAVTPKPEGCTDKTNPFENLVFAGTDTANKICKNVKASIDGGKTKIDLKYTGEDMAHLTGSISLPVTATDKQYAVELFWGDEVCFGKLASATQAAAKPIAASDLTIVPSKDFETLTAPGAAPLYANELSQKNLALGFGLGENFTFAKGTDFNWTSSDESIATIAYTPDTRQAQIAPTGKPGSVSFTLTATNGGIFPSATKTSATLTVASGGSPFLSIPGGMDTLSIFNSQPCAINWTANLCEKNGETPTTFTVKVQERDSRGDEVYSNSVSGTKSKPVNGLQIPKDILTKNITYYCTVSTNYPEIQPVTLTIRVKANAAAAKLTRPSSGLYVLDTAGASSPLAWDIVNWDNDNPTANQFELLVTNSRGETMYRNTAPSSSGTGSFATPRVNTQNGNYRDIYTVTLKAKNGTDANWSNDSYLYYVYSDAALKIWVRGTDGTEKVLSEKGNLTMSNIPAISKMSQSQIVALNRDIALRDIISANYGEYAYAQISDQLAWKDTTPGVASVNYQQMGAYENIDRFAYPTYRPATDFVLSGLAAGTTTVTATHPQTKDVATLAVTVETLKDKLYLFKLYPATQTQLTYTNGDGVEKTVTSEADGRAAIYEENGINSDVLCRSESGGNVYLGTIYRDTLLSSERDSTQMQLYPVNQLQLRRAAYAEIYLKKQDSWPYMGDVTLRAGVYRNGEYCKTAQFALNGQKLINQDGKEDMKANLGKDGKISLTMDVTQFVTEKDQTPVGPDDDIQYMVELHTGDDKSYYPIFTAIDATLNADDVVSSGDSIFQLEMTTQKENFVAMQTVRYSENGSRSSVRRGVESIGPSTNYPEVWLSTSVLWWEESAEGNASGEHTVTLEDAYGKTLPNQQIETIQYPFSDLQVTVNNTRLNQSTMESLMMSPHSSRKLDIVLLNRYIQHKSMPARLVNMMGAEDVTKAPGVLDIFTNIKKNTKADGSTKIAEMSSLDAMVGIGLTLLAGDSKNATQQTGDLRLVPTADPLRFKGFFALNAGNSGLQDSVTSMYGDQADSNGKKKTGSDFGYFPSPLAIYQMCKGSYKDEQKDDYNKASNGQGVRNFTGGLGGYLECDVVYKLPHAYDTNKEGYWTVEPVSGGFHANAGMSYSWFVNNMVGPVPVTLSVELGGNMAIRLDVQHGNYTSYKADSPQWGQQVKATDYLTELRIGLYIRAFAGVGFDYSVIAFKIGVFSEINADFRFKYFNRPFLDTTQATRNEYRGPNVTGKEDYYLIDSELDGQKIVIGGNIGVEMLAKFLFISYHKVLCSHTFEIYNGSFNDWVPIEQIWAANKKINGSSVLQVLMGSETYYAIDLGASMESRDYLRQAKQSYNLDGGIDLFSLDTDNKFAKEQWGNIYPYLAPTFADDGSQMLYLSDQNSLDITQTRVAAAKLKNDKYPQGTVIDDGGYGDSALSVTGEGNHVAAAWVRQSGKLDKNEGTPLTEAEQMIQTNYAEVMASIYDGSHWTTTQLTNNKTPDLAPVIATNGTKTLVAWREVLSTSAGALTSFGQKDYIVYRIYDGSAWSDTATLYDGTGGGVKGIQTAMLTDGTVAVTYTLDTDSDDATTADRETVCAIVEAKGTDVRTIRLTENSNLDDNPQIAAVKFTEPADVGTTEVERFVIGWHAERPVDGGTGEDTQADIHMMALDASGNPYANMPDSIGAVTAGTDVTVGSNFRFAKNADSIENLSLAWTESVGPASETKGKSLYQQVGYDVLKAVEFSSAHDTISLSAPTEVAKMQEGVLIDSFDAYVSDPSTHELKALILGTDYNHGTTEKQATVTNGDGKEETITIAVPNAISGLYSATETYENKVTLQSVFFEYPNIQPSSNLPVEFTLRNDGRTPISAITLTVGGQAKTYTDLALAPNRSITLTADCPVSAEVENVSYKVEATFESKDTSTLSGADCILYLAMPDVGLSGFEIMEAENGKRVLRYSLYNRLKAPLAGSGKTVHLGLFADQACTEPLPNTTPVVLSNSDLAMIDAGGYSGQLTFDIAAYLGEGKEIPSSGVAIYAKTWITENSGGEALTQPEYYENNNVRQVDCKSLIDQNQGEKVTLEQELTYNSAGIPTANITIRNNSLTEVATGNLIVSLLDDSGNIVEQQQSYQPEQRLGGNGLITLPPEGVVNKEITFTQKGKSITLSYGELILTDPSAELNSLKFTALPVALSDFTEAANGKTEDGTLYEHTITVADMEATTHVSAGAKSAAATVTITSNNANDPVVMARNATTPINIASGTAPLRPEQQTVIDVVVTNGTQKSTYRLTVLNKSSVPVVEKTESVATVDYGEGTATVSVVAKPGSNGVVPTLQWYTCDNMEKKNPQIVAAATEASYTLPQKTAVGTYYYFCRITAQNGGQSFVTDSSVVEVEVEQATTPFITWPTAKSFVYGTALKDVPLKGAGLVFPNDFTPTYSIGGFAWSAKTTVPTVDTKESSVAYTPSADIKKNYKAFAAENDQIPQNVAITVQQATAPTVRWPAAKPIIYGQTLADATLTEGTLSFSGTYNPNRAAADCVGFAWNNPAEIPTVTNSGFPQTATPTDFITTNYSAMKELNTTQAVTVNRAAPTVNAVSQSAQMLGKTVMLTVTLTNPQNSSLTTGFPAASAVTIVPSNPAAGTLSEVTTNGAGVYTATYTVSSDETLVAKGDVVVNFSVNVAQSDNYLAASGSAALTIGKKNASIITLAGSENITYGDGLTIRGNVKKSAGVVYPAQPTGRLNFTLERKGSGDSWTSVKTQESIAQNGSELLFTLSKTELTSIKNGQTYRITAHYSGDGEYMSGSQTVLFSVAQKPLTITADSMSAYVGALPSPSQQYAGFVAGEDKSVLINATAVHTAVTDSPAGVYPIHAAGSSNHYAITLVDATLTLKPCPKGTQPPAAISPEPDKTTGRPGIALAPAQLEALKKQTVSKDAASIKLMTVPLQNGSAELEALLAKLSGYRPAEGGALEISLVDSSDGNRILTCDTPITLKFLYPKGLGQYGFQYVLLHEKNGEITALQPEAAEENGVIFQTNNGLSPFLLGYYQIHESPDIPDYTVTASSNLGGTVTPPLSKMRRNTNCTLKFTPNTGYHIADVQVNGVSVGAVAEYTIEKIKENTEVFVRFEVDRVMDFSDVHSGDWFYGAVRYVFEMGIMEGTDKNIFAPQGTVTRGTVATILHRMAGKPQSGQSAAFTDVVPSAWYAQGVYWAAENGIAGGYDSKTFGPNDSLTREQLATMLYRYAKPAAADADMKEFTDATTISDFAKPAMGWAVADGILQGSNGKLCPQGLTTRAEIAAIFQRFLEKTKISQ